MKALSIKQPWAWLIIHGGKDIENRTWHTNLRGRFLVHASKGMTKAEYFEALEVVVRSTDAETLRSLPMMEDLQRGGIVGSVELVDSVDTSISPWYMGEKGFVLRDPRPLPFIQMKGRLGFFDVPADAVCTCPSGDGSLRWPCPVHPPEE
ncbi:ASCH domain-containing protein [Pseudomonas sp. S07E 245]|uniref:ASCH domain-containing protein n=1 Tax=Pseudomonas sp. S07E 245 TaxID=2866278 RepID=UPI001C736D86|nr:ASCH domain-containing protein [Pseudomonas sp. S07E 245]QYX54405.1 ASCH domain-containing protein [Pseudomonas sp. S07E 245]